jgi:hypothetical protein
MKVAKKIILVFLVILVIIQFIRPAKNISAAATGKEIEKMYPVPDSVQQILQKACYDCHSNNTRYPWYAQVQPVGWWLANHIKDGKEELNFSEFGNYPLKRQSKKLKKSAKEVQEGGMPLSSYTLIHTDAKLTDAEKQAYINWATALSNTIAAQLPPDEKK